MPLLNNNEHDTLQRMVEEYGLKVVSEHIDISTHALKRVIDDMEHEISEEHYNAIMAYLRSRV